MRLQFLYESLKKLNRGDRRMVADDIPPAQRLMRMIGGFQLSQAIHVAAMLRIADQLAEGPCTATDLAARVEANPDALRRVLRFLASHGIFAEDDAGRFGLTPLAEPLRDDVPGSVAAMARMVCESSFWMTWGDLLATVRTGEPAFPRVHGMDHWSYLALHPEENAAFNATMTEFSLREAAAITAAYDFSPYEVVADVGGGAGALVAAILRANPATRAILFDRPNVVAEASALLDEAGVADRCEVAAGDFFDSVPTGADAYLLKSIIHDWDSDDAAKVLRNCRIAMTERSKLIVIERIILPGNVPDPSRGIDLMMMVMVGGRERTVDEYGELLQETGFRLDRTVTTASPLTIIEATPV